MIYKLINLIKNYKIIMGAVLFYFSLFISSTFIYLKFDVVLSPDFEKYYRYFEQYSGLIQFTNLEQGHTYFFLHYLVFMIFLQFSEGTTLNEIVNLSIHFFNSLIFLYGCIGLKKYLKTRFSNLNSYIVISVICFLPSSFELRTTLKPEILAFSLIGWLFYYLYKISEENKNIYKINFSIGLSLLVTSKISIAVLVSLLFFIEIITRHKHLISKVNLKFLILIFVLSSTLLIENYRINDKYIFEVEHNENYNNKAEPDFFLNFASQDFKNNPNKYFHNDSFLAITFFDTFNDFFQIYWNSEYTEFNKERKEFFKIQKIQNIQPPYRINYDEENGVLTLAGNFDHRWDDFNYINETRMRTGFFFSAIFYFLILLFSIFKKDSRSILISPFIGMLVVTLSALGIFGTNNFDPLVGDSMKTYYYSFFIVPAFSVLISEIFSFEYFKKIITFICILFFLFFLGFPFSYSEETEKDIIYKNSLLITCELNNPILKDLYNFESQTKCTDITNPDDKFTPMTKVREINSNLSLIPYFNVLFVFLYFIFNVSHVRKSKLVNKIIK